MHFYQENGEKNLLKRHHSPQNHQSKGCTAENIHSCIRCITILILRNKLDLVHLKQAGGLCKITLRNTPHVSDKAYRNFQIRLLSEISATIRTFAETEKKKKIDRGIKKL